MKTTLRSLRQRPVFSLTVIVTLALSLGLVGAILSLLHEVFVQPLPYPRADRLAVLTSTFPAQNWPNASANVPELRDLAARTRALESVAVYASFRPLTLTGDGPAEQIATTFCDADYLPLQGATPARGRLFTAAEAQRGADAPFIVVQHRFWQNRLGGRDDVIGLTLRLNGRPFTVIGVLPAGFRSVGERRDLADIFVPLSSAPLLYGEAMWENRAGREFWSLARLKPAVTVESAQRELDEIARQLAAEFPEFQQGRGFALHPLRTYFYEEVRGVALALGAGAAFVLLIAGVNLAHLFLVRGEARRRDFAVRAALGATRAQLWRQCLAEVAVLSVVGGAAGIVLSSELVALFNRAGALRVPTFTVFAISPAIVAATLVLLVACALGFGLWPAWRASRVDLREALGAGDRAAGDRKGARRRFAFISAEVTLAVLLLVGAGLTVRTLLQIDRRHPGYDPERLLTALLELDRSRFPTAEALARTHRQLHEQIQAIPGTESAVLWAPRVLGRATFNVLTTPPGLDVAEPKNRYMTRRHSVTPDALPALRIPLVAGSYFNPALGPDAPLEVIVGENYARRFFSGGDAVGQTLKVVSGGRALDARIIGVARDVRHLGRTFDESGIIGDIYFSLWQTPASSLAVILRYQGDAAGALAALRERVTQFDRNIALADIATMEVRNARQEGMHAFTASVFTVYASLATFLAALGVYGVLAFAVAQRTREFGVRLAVGARPAQILGQLLREGMGWIGLGAAAGLGGALYLSRLIRSLLIGVEPTDPAVFAVTAGAILVLGLIACLVPAWRASRTDPLVALRSE
jgi:predicted permease